MMLLQQQRLGFLVCGRELSGRSRLDEIVDREFFVAPPNSLFVAVEIGTMA